MGSSDGCPAAGSSAGWTTWRGSTRLPHPPAWRFVFVLLWLFVVPFSGASPPAPPGTEPRRHRHKWWTPCPFPQCRWKHSEMTRTIRLPRNQKYEWDFKEVCSPAAGAETVVWPWWWGPAQWGGSLWGHGGHVGPDRSDYLGRSKQSLILRSNCGGLYSFSPIKDFSSHSRQTCPLVSPGRCVRTESALRWTWLCSQSSWLRGRSGRCEGPYPVNKHNNSYSHTVNNDHNNNNYVWLTSYPAMRSPTP